MSRLLHWLVFGVGLGAIPYATVLIVGWLDAADGGWSFPPSTELVFLSIATSIAAFVELAAGLIAGTRRWLRTRIAFLVVIGGYVLCASVFYGLFVQHASHSPAVRAGVDCAALRTPPRSGDAAAAASPTRRTAEAIRAGLRGVWGPDCAEWYAKQVRYFQRSQVAVMFSLILGGIAVLALGTADERTLSERWR